MSWLRVLGIGDWDQPSFFIENSHCWCRQMISSHFVFKQNLLLFDFATEPGSQSKCITSIWLQEESSEGFRSLSLFTFLPTEANSGRWMPFSSILNLNWWQRLIVDIILTITNNDIFYWYRASPFTKCFLMGF